MASAHEAFLPDFIVNAGPCLGLRQAFPRTKGVIAQIATSFHDAPAEGKEEEKKEGEGGGGACFPPTASVYVKGRGPVPIATLQHGDVLLCGDADTGALFFSPFAGYLHSDPASSMSCVSVRTRHFSGELVASREHLVFAAESRSSELCAVRAELLQPGQWVLRVGCDGVLQRAEIEEKPARLVAKGRYAPLTQRGTVVVDGVLCSCYIDACADAAPAWLRLLGASHLGTHGLLLPLRLAARLGLRAPPKSADGLDMYCRTLLRLTSTIQAIA